jgi:hypothetical protein
VGVEEVLGRDAVAGPPAVGQGVGQAADECGV